MLQQRYRLSPSTSTAPSTHQKGHYTRDFRKYLRKAIARCRFLGMIGVLLVNFSICDANAGLISPQGSEYFLQLSHSFGPPLVSDIIVPGTLPWTTYHSIKQDTSATFRTGTWTTIDTSSPMAAVGITDLTGIYFNHSASLNTVEFARLSVSSSLTFGIQGNLQVARSDFHYWGELAPGDEVRIEYRPSMRRNNRWPPADLGTYDQTFTNNTNDVMRLSDVLPGAIVGTEHTGPYVFNYTLDLFIRITIHKDPFSGFHQSTGTTWVNIDPAIGAGDPGEDFVPLLNSLSAANAVPEPGSMILWGIGGIALTSCGYRRTRLHSA